ASGTGRAPRTKTAIATTATAATAMPPPMSQRVRVVRVGMALPPPEQAGAGRSAAHARELLHDPLHLAELLDQAIDLRQGGPRAVRDPPPSRCVEDTRLTPLARRHRADDRLGPAQVAPVDGVLGLLGHPAHARDHRHDLAQRSHLLDLLELLEKVLEGELGLPELGLELRRLGRVDVL